LTANFEGGHVSHPTLPTIQVSAKAHVDIVAHLLAQGAIVDTTDKIGAAALGFAVRRGTCMTFLPGASFVLV
jgi:hypothetical protein